MAPLASAILPAKLLGFRHPTAQSEPAMKPIRQILEDAHTIAVVGLSPKPERASLGVATYLQAHGYRIVPVNPNYAGQQILGEQVYPDLRTAADALAADGIRIDVVDCFRKPEEIGAIARDAIAVHAGALWMQLGIENQAAADVAAAAGLDVVMNHCMKLEHARMMSMAGQS
jgi:predicted CoA-binding protein